MREYLVVGYGKLGRYYDSLLDARFVVDIVPVNDIIGKVFYTSIDEFLFFRPQVDLAIVSTLSNMHYTIAKKLLLEGYNVLVEKPITLSSVEARDLVSIARRSKLLCYQSTMERRNSLITFLKENVSRDQIERIVSVRQGLSPTRAYVESPVFDLGIHDLDLSYFLYQNEIPWEINVSYCSRPMRKIFVFLKSGQCIELDLLNKQAIANERTFDLSKSSNNNQMLLMLQQILYAGSSSTEDWDREIQTLEELALKKSSGNFTLREKPWKGAHNDV